MLCDLDDELKVKLKNIYDDGEKLFPNFSDDTENKKRRIWYECQYKPLGISQKEWLMFVCDEMSIIGIC